MMGAEGRAVSGAALFAFLCRERNLGPQKPRREATGKVRPPSRARNQVREPRRRQRARPRRGAHAGYARKKGPAASASAGPAAAERSGTERDGGATCRRQTHRIGRTGLPLQNPLSRLRERLGQSPAAAQQRKGSPDCEGTSHPGPPSQAREGDSGKGRLHTQTGHRICALCMRIMTEHDNSQLLQDYRRCRAATRGKCRPASPLGGRDRRSPAFARAGRGDAKERCPHANHDIP